MFEKLEEPKDLRNPDIVFPETNAYRKMELWMEERYYRDKGVLYIMDVDVLNSIMNDMLQGLFAPIHKELVANYLVEKELLGE